MVGLDKTDDTDRQDKLSPWFRVYNPCCTRMRARLGNGSRSLLQRLTSLRTAVGTNCANLLKTKQNMSSCCVTGCKSRHSSGSKLRFYRIPSGKGPFRKNRRRLWLQAIQQVNGSTEGLKGNVRVCGAHFISGKIVQCNS